MKKEAKFAKKYPDIVISSINESYLYITHQNANSFLAEYTVIVLVILIYRYD